MKKSQSAQVVASRTKPNHKASMVAKMAAISAPAAPRPRREGAALPESPPVVVAAAATAWMPKVVPVMT